MTYTLTESETGHSLTIEPATGQGGPFAIVSTSRAGREPVEVLLTSEQVHQLIEHLSSMTQGLRPVGRA